MSPPDSEWSLPTSECPTDAPSTTTRTRSNGVNWPTVRLPHRRTNARTATQTAAPLSTISHHGWAIPNRVSTSSYTPAAPVRRGSNRLGEDLAVEIAVRGNRLGEG